MQGCYAGVVALLMAFVPALALPLHAWAADPAADPTPIPTAPPRPGPVPIPAPAATWSGFHVGGHVGGFTGATNFSDDAGRSLYGGWVDTPGFALGLQFGYDWMLSPRWLFGLEASGSWLSASGNNTCLQASVDFIGSNCKAAPREVATLTGRLGFAAGPEGRTLIYGKGGLAYMRSELSINPNNAFRAHEGDLTGDPLVQGTPTVRALQGLGWTVGLGVEHALSPNWSMAFDYNYMRFTGLGLPTPESVEVTPAGAVNGMPPDYSNVTQDLHLLKLGLNYRFGARPRTSAGETPPPAEPREGTGAGEPWRPGWEFEIGGRYWYSTGKYQGANGNNNILVSRLTYQEMIGHSGEVFGRADTPADLFVKGFIGGGFISAGRLHDEDWGLSGTGEPTIAYEYTESSVTGSFNYLTVDAGYNLMRGRDHKLGLFVGYNRYQVTMSGFGCAQMVNPQSVCSPPSAPNVNAISEIDTWHSLRTGVSAEIRLFDRLRIGGDFAYLPYVYVDAMDIHHMRQPTDFFPVQGRGKGVQTELVLTWQATDRISLGIGGRYWAMWTSEAFLRWPGNGDFVLNTERYGVFVQGAYRFGLP